MATAQIQRERKCLAKRGKLTMLLQAPQAHLPSGSVLPVPSPDTALPSRPSLQTLVLLPNPCSSRDPQPSVAKGSAHPLVCTQGKRSEIQSAPEHIQQGHQQEWGLRGGCAYRYPGKRFPVHLMKSGKISHKHFLPEKIK